MIIRFFIAYLVWILIYFSLQHMMNRKIEIKEMTTVAILGLLIGYIATWGLPSETYSVLTLVLFFAYCYKKLKIPLWKSAIFSLIIGIVFGMFGRVTVEILVQLFWNGDRTQRANPETIYGLFLYFPIYVTLTLSSLLILRGFLRKLPRKIVDNVPIQIVTTISLLFIYIIPLSYPCVYQYLYDCTCVWETEDNIALLNIILAFLSTVFIAFGLVIAKRRAERKLEQEKMENYFQTVEGRYTEVRKFKHDYKNILSSMDSYIEEADLEGLKEYYYRKIKPSSRNIDGLNFQLENISRIKVKEVKSLISEKLLMATELGIDVTLEVWAEIDFIPINSVNFVRKMGIILDNAIEELAELRTGKLQVAVIKNENGLVCIVQNTCRDDVPKISQLKLEGFSTKGKNRGLGFSNLLELVSQHENVVLETTVNENVFTQKLVIGG